MRLEPEPTGTAEITSESEFYQRVKKRTAGVIAWERIEPSNESGFPDAYFIIKSTKAKRREGTVELKYWDGKGRPQLNGDLVRGTQKAALIEYVQAGGNRRFYVVYSNHEVWLFNTADAYHSVTTGETRSTGLARLEEPAFAHWLMSCLEN